MSIIIAIPTLLHHHYMLEQLNGSLKVIFTPQEMNYTIQGKKKSLKFLDYFPASETSHLRMQINQQKYSKVVYLLEDRKKKKKRRDGVGGEELTNAGNQ